MKKDPLTLPLFDAKAAATHFRKWQSIDLCSGLGGFSIAAEMLGIRPTAAIDNWSLATEVYSKNYPEVTAKTADINQARNRQFLRDEAAQDEIDIVFAGPPCQGFTQLRNHNRTLHDPNIRVTHAVTRSLEEIEPRVFLIENVPLLLNHHGGDFGKALMAKLERLGSHGYHVHAQIVNAASFGVPQQRRRLLLLGTRKDQEFAAVPPAPTELNPYLTARRRGLPFNSFAKEADVIRKDRDDLRITTVQQALDDLPVLNAGEDPDYPTYGDNPTPYQRLMRGKQGVPTMVSTPRMQQSTKQVLARIPPGRCLQDLAKRKRAHLKRKHFSAYRRLHPDLPATTLFTKIDCAYHYEQLRALSVREYARLQSIPDSFKFPVANRNAYAMIGNSVPPLLIANFLANAIGPSATSTPTKTEKAFKAG